MIRVILTNTNAGNCSACDKTLAVEAESFDSEDGVIVCTSAGIYHPRCYNNLGGNVRVHASDSDHRCHVCMCKLESYRWQVSSGWKAGGEAPIKRHHIECWNEQDDITLPRNTPADFLKFVDSRAQKVPWNSSAPVEAPSTDPWPLDQSPRENGGDLSIDAADIELEIWEATKKCQ